MSGQRLARQEVSDAVTGLGWRLVLGQLRAYVPVGSMAQAAEVAQRVVAACGPDADGHLWLDLRQDRVALALQTLGTAWVSAADIDAARRISSTVAEFELVTEADIGDRSVQVLEIAIDAMDIAAVRPFWKAVLGYADEVAGAGPEDPLVDPVGQGPAVWFQQMDVPREQRNRIHFDVSVPHDEAQRRVQAALAAGGTLRSDAAAPAFWVLADAEGNEACVTTWQGRDD